MALLIARSITLTGLAILVLATVVVIARVHAMDPAHKAGALAVGISELMNGGVVLFLAALSSALVWGVARWRLRAAKR